MNIVSRIPTELARERVAGLNPAPQALPPGREQALADHAVQGVVVEPLRESKVSVRVEIVTDSDRRQQAVHHADAQATYADANGSNASWASVAELPPSAAGRLGSPDLRQAASAYRAHADWQPYGGSTAEPPRRLSIRA